MTQINGYTFGRRLATEGRRGLTNRMGSPDGIAIATYLSDNVRSFSLRDDFAAPTIDAAWTQTKDAAATNFAKSAGAGGRIVGATGANNGEGQSIFGGFDYLPSKNCGMAIRFQLDVVTNVAFETGFVDAATDKTTITVTDVDTPTIGNGAAKVALLVMDTSQTLTTMSFVTAGTAAKDDIGTLAPTAATYLTAVIYTNGTMWECALLDENEVPRKTTAGGTTFARVGRANVTAATALAPCFTIINRTGSSHAALIDYIWAWADR